MIWAVLFDHPTCHVLGATMSNVSCVVGLAALVFGILSSHKLVFAMLGLCATFFIDVPVKLFSLLKYGAVLAFMGLKFITGTCVCVRVCVWRSALSSACGVVQG